MEAPMAGIVTIAFVLLLSRRQAWNAAPAKIPILLATVLFACALLFPTIAVVEKSSTWLIAGHAATALGAIFLVTALLMFEPRGLRNPDRPKKRKRKSSKTATKPPAAGANEPELPAPDPDDPYSGPHGARS